MKLLRIAMVYITPPPEGWDSWKLQVGRITVRTMVLGKAPIVERTKRLLLTSEIEMGTLPVTGADGFIDIPDAERRACEQGIETAANIIAVLTRSSRRISSAWPPVAFVPETDDERDYLDASSGIRYRHLSAVTAEAATPMTEDLLLSLADRPEGIASLADFFSTNHALAQYREAARVFEMAFALPVSQLEKKLTQFLSSGPFGYTRDEVSSWLLHRHGAVHGDRKKTKGFTWESDVRVYIDRIEQALLDILFNKVHWRNSSKRRRHLWKPAYGTSSPAGDVFITQGVGGKLGLSMLDAWGAFPLDLSSLDSPPAAWWCKIAESPAGSRDA